MVHARYEPNFLREPKLFPRVTFLSNLGIVLVHLASQLASLALQCTCNAYGAPLKCSAVPFFKAFALHRRKWLAKYKAVHCTALSFSSPALKFFQLFIWGPIFPAKRAIKHPPFTNVPEVWKFSTSFESKAWKSILRPVGLFYQCEFVKDTYKYKYKRNCKYKSRKKRG